MTFAECVYSQKAIIQSLKRGFLFHQPNPNFIASLSLFMVMREFAMNSTVEKKKQQAHYLCSAHRHVCVIWVLAFLLSLHGNCPSKIGIDQFFQLTFCISRNRFKDSLLFCD